MQVLDIDLNKEPEVAATLADLEPGQKVYFCATLKSKDEQTAQVRLTEVGLSPDELPEPDEYAEDETDEEAPTSETDEAAEPAEEAEGMGRKLAKRLMTGG